MLRLMIRTTRRRNTNNYDDDSTTMEAWPEYIRRATTAAENHLSRLQIETWTTSYFTRKWRWAARIAKQPTNRWTRLTSAWQPEHNLQRPTTRRQARPHKRWSDDLQAFLSTIHAQPPHWLQAASNDTNWATLEHKFITYMNTPTILRQQRPHQVQPKSQPLLATQQCQGRPQSAQLPQPPTEIS